jgi:hypothetical protein
MTRRELVGGVAGAAAGAALAPAAAVAAGPSDHALLSRVLDVERLLVWAYERVLAVGTLEPAARPVVESLLAHEREHVATLTGILGRAPVPALTTEAALAQLGHHNVVASPTALGTQRHSLRLLVDLESVGEGAWFSAIAKFSDPGMASLGAQIMACEAQHWTVLSGLSHPGRVKITVPYAFVRGTH